MNVKRESFKAEGLERISRNPRLANRRAVGGKPLTGPSREIQEMRKALGLTQAQLASALGIRSSMIANLENGRYAAFILVGIKMYLFFARTAAEKGLTPLYLEAKGEVVRFIAWQRKLSAEALKKVEQEAQKKRKKHEVLEKQLADEEARLREL